MSFKFCFYCTSLVWICTFVAFNYVF